MDPSRPAGRRVSRQRYLLRRVGTGVVALVVLFVGGFLLVRLAGALGGGEDGADAIAPVGTDGASTTAGTVPGVTDPTVPVAPTTVVATTVAPTAAPTTSAVVAPTPEDPVRVLVVGDSDAGTFGPYLEQLLDETGVVATTVDYKVSSGLARPDFYDWPAHLAATLPSEQPDIVVVTFGGNDAQGLSNADGSNPSEWHDPVAARESWLAEYSRRAGAVMDQLGEGGRLVVWVGIPNDDGDEMTERLEVQDQAVAAALATRPSVRFVDTWSLFSSPNGGWAEYAVDPRDGEGKDVRADDGFHLNENGAEILAVRIADLVKADLTARGAAL